MMTSFSDLMKDPRVRTLMQEVHVDEFRAALAYMNYMYGPPGTMRRIEWDVRGVPGVIEVSVGQLSGANAVVKVRPVWWVRLIPLGRWCLRKRVAARIEWQRPCGAVYRVEVS
jgi:hypothetical protein